MKTKKTYRYPSEVFTKLGEIDSFHDRVAYLQEEQTFAIRTILQCNFTPTIRLDLPDGTPPFTRDILPGDNSLARLDRVIKSLGRIALIGDQAPAVGLEKMRKETQYIKLLESVNEADADVIIAMKDKALTKKFPVLDYVLVKAAFPTLLP